MVKKRFIWVLVTLWCFMGCLYAQDSIRAFKVNYFGGVRCFGGAGYVDFNYRVGVRVFDGVEFGVFKGVGVLGKYENKGLFCGRYWDYMWDGEFGFGLDLGVEDMRRIYYRGYFVPVVWRFGDNMRLGLEMGCRRIWNLEGGIFFNVYVR